MDRQRRRHHPNRPRGLPPNGGAVGDRRRPRSIKILQPIRRPPLDLPAEAKRTDGAAGGGKAKGDHAGSSRREALGAEFT